MSAPVPERKNHKMTADLTKATMSLSGKVPTDDFSAADAEAIARRLVRDDVTTHRGSFVVTSDYGLGPACRQYSAEFSLSAPADGDHDV